MDRQQIEKDLKRIKSSGCQYEAIKLLLDDEFECDGEIAEWIELLHIMIHKMS